jgi:NAD(P)-dependent dehydrogenase (short-subunit alcohol dehydrogenase family)
MEHRGNIIITGAAGAIGRAVTSLLAAEGHRLFLVDRDEPGLQSMAARHPSAVPMLADVADAAQMAAVVGRASPGGLSAVILAAGTEGPVGALEDCDEEEFDAVMHLNVKSVWLGLKLCLPVMKHQGCGSIVALSSISGVMAAPMLSAYAASKHAVVGLVRSAAREAASFNVRVNALCPAPVDSDMMRRIDGALSEKFPARLAGGSDAAKLVPLQRYATVDEVAQAAVFLCSDASSYCTGSTFMVDGGISCR